MGYLLGIILSLIAVRCRDDDVVFKTQRNPMGFVV